MPSITCTKLLASESTELSIEDITTNQHNKSKYFLHKICYICACATAKPCSKVTFSN